MPAFILIGLGGGLASGVLFASAAAGGGAARMLLYLLAPLPSFLAGLGWGSVAAGIAALAGALCIGIVLGSMAAVLFFLTQAAPVAIICHLALLNRPAAIGASNTGAPAVEWYPLGRLLAIATLMAGVLATLTLLVLGPDLDTLRALLRELIEKVFLKELPGLQERQLQPDDIATITEFSLQALPAASAMTWLGGFLLNFWLAGRITLASGRLLRPWPDVAAIAFPRGFALGLAAAFALTFLAGYPRLVGSGFAGGFFLAYLLMGLAIVHYITRGQASRPFVLWAMYLALLILNTWAALILALLALMEPLLPLKRFGSSGQAGPD